MSRGRGSRVFVVTGLLIGATLQACGDGRDERASAAPRGSSGEPAGGTTTGASNAPAPGGGQSKASDGTGRPSGGANGPAAGDPGATTEETRALPRDQGLVEVTTLASGTCSGQANCASPPLAGVTVAIRRGDREVTRAVTDENGHATFALDPGDYLVAGQPKEGYRVTPSPWPVTVEKGSSVDVELYYETGAQ